MKAKDFMESVRRANADLQVLADQRQHLMQLGGALGANITGVPGSTDKHSRVEAAAVQMVMLDIDGKLSEYGKLLRTGLELVGEIPADNFRKVLIYYYFQGLSWSEVGKMVGYKDDKSVYHARDHALRALQQVMDGK